MLYSLVLIALKHLAAHLKVHLINPPSAFREQPRWSSWRERFVFSLPPREIMMNVNIVERAEEKSAFISHHSAPERVFESAAQFIQWRKETGLSAIAKSRT